LLVEPFALVEPASRPFRPMVPVALLADIPLLMITLHRKLVERELMPLGVHLNVLSDLEELIIAELTRLTRLGMFNLDVWQMKNKPSNYQPGLVHVIFTAWLYSMKALYQSACANLISEEPVVPFTLHPAPKEQPPRKLSGKRTDIVIDL
jgi:hypothetical protein